MRIRLHLERAVSEPELRLAARQGDVDVVALQLQDAERRADEVERERRGKRRLQLLGAQPVDLEVKVLRRAAEKPVAHAAADQQRAPARVPDKPRDVKNGRVPHAFAGPLARHRRFVVFMPIF